ncbi:FixH family protein [Campylobacter sp.]|uniref:FixH family protein n=1 Tax=Campylobacter sp. TaxID=205 RepID=UPI0026DCE606|nr:FixH family protein [Campylobacter sp.]MDO4674229.1 FixH family protein [Campylobacter sp.]
MPKKKTFWPYGIVLSILAIVAACVATIIFASQYPVYEDDSFFLSYQEVKDDYDKIELKQENFEKNFSLRLEDKGLERRLIDTKRKREAYVLNDSNLTLILAKQQGGGFDFKDLNLTVKLTRPHTSEDDVFLQGLGEQTAMGMLYSFILPPLTKGRWQLKVKAENEQILGFKSFEFFVP